MSARGFGSVLSAGAVVGAALGFYLVSLRVASERAALEEVETRIAMTQRDIRLLQTEIGTRGRLAQLERWNVRFIRLSAPNADQFVNGGFQLASLVAPRKIPAVEAPVVLAAASIPPTDGQRLMGGPPESGLAASPPSRPVGEMMHVASYQVPQPKAAPSAPGHTPTLASPERAKPVAARPEAVTASNKGKVNTAKPVKTATADPLAPLAGANAKAKGSLPAATANSGNPKSKTRDSDD